MTREEALKKAINIVAYFEAHFAKSKEAREDAANIIEALEQEPCEDAISRQAVFEQINCWIGSGEYRYTNAMDYLNKRIKALQAVNPQEPNCKDCDYKEWLKDEIEPKTGHWIDTGSESFEFHRVYKCSECGNTEIEYPEGIRGHFRYCPNCGAKMFKPQENEET